MAGTILVTDDELGYREMLKQTLTKKGYEVLTAASGLEALGILMQHKVDVVVTDMKMPKSDGLTLIAAIRKYHPTTPVVLITAFAIDEKIQIALDQQIAGCLKKPFEIAELLKVLDGAMAALPK